MSINVYQLTNYWMIQNRIIHMPCSWKRLISPEYLLEPWLDKIALERVGPVYPQFIQYFASFRNSGYIVSLIPIQQSGEMLDCNRLMAGLVIFKNSDFVLAILYFTTPIYRWYSWPP